MPLDIFMTSYWSAADLRPPPSYFTYLKKFLNKMIANEKIRPNSILHHYDAHVMKRKSPLM